MASGSAKASPSVYNHIEIKSNDTIIGYGYKYGRIRVLHFTNVSEEVSSDGISLPDSSWNADGRVYAAVAFFRNSNREVGFIKIEPNARLLKPIIPNGTTVTVSQIAGTVVYYAKNE